MYIIAALLLGYAGWLWLGAYAARNGGEVQPNPQYVVTESTNKPSEQPAPVTASYSVASNLPRSIKIPAIGVHEYIQHVGTDKEGRIAVPTNIYFAGWFTDSAIPGQPGVSILDGHVHGRYDPGIFHDLHKLRKGSEITIQFGDLHWRTFTVTATRLIDATNDEVVTAPLTDSDPNTAELRLITCEDYDRKTGTYAKRLIVYAR